MTSIKGRERRKEIVPAADGCCKLLPREGSLYHRDLNLGNVLIDAKGNIKVFDFGLSALPQHQRKDGLLNTTCGSPNYIAPKVLLNRGYDGFMFDIWSYGVILYVILTSNLPFDDQNMIVLYQKILKGVLIFLNGFRHVPKIYYKKSWILMIGSIKLHLNFMTREALATLNVKRKIYPNEAA